MAQRPRTPRERTTSLHRSIEATHLRDVWPFSPKRFAFFHQFSRNSYFYSFLRSNSKSSFVKTRVLTKSSTYKIFLAHRNKSALIETRESNGCHCSHFVLFIEETTKNQCVQSFSKRSCIEQITKDHILYEFHRCTTRMPFGTVADLRGVKDWWWTKEKESENDLFQFFNQRRK